MHKTRLERFHDTLCAFLKEIEDEKKSYMELFTHQILKEESELAHNNVDATEIDYRFSTTKECYEKWELEAILSCKNKEDFQFFQKLNSINRKKREDEVKSHYYKIFFENNYVCL